MADITGGVNVGALIASLGLDTTQFMAGMNMAEKRMQTASVKLASLGAKMQQTGRKMTMALSLPILGIGAAAFKAQKDFEKSMSKIVGLVGVAESTVKSWEKSILALGPAVGKGPEELADAMFFIASAGIRGAEALDVLEMSAKASAAGLGETKVVADLVTSAMNAYGKENLSAAMATDILTAAVREGKAEADQLAGAMGIVLPIAAEMNVKFDQVGAAMAAMTRTGTNASIAATQLKAIMSSLLKPTQQSAEAMEDMGFSAATVRKTIREEGLIQALEDLRLTTNKYGEEAMSKVFPNIRALMGVLDLMGKNAADNIEIFDSLTNATGSLDAAFEAATKTTQFKWDKAVAQIKTTFTKLGGVLQGSIIPIIENVTEKISAITERFMKLDEAQKQNVLRFAALTAVVGPLIAVLGRLMTFIAANPYLALAGAIGMIVFNISRLIRTSKEAKTTQDDFITGTSEAVKALEAEQVEVTVLVRELEDLFTTKEDQKRIYDELKAINPEIVAGIDREKMAVEDLVTQAKAYNNTIIDRITLQNLSKKEENILARRAHFISRELELQRQLQKILAERNIAGLTASKDFQAISDAINDLDFEALQSFRSTISALGNADFADAVSKEFAIAFDEILNIKRNADTELADSSGTLARIRAQMLILRKELGLAEVPGDGGGGEGGGGGGSITPIVKGSKNFDDILRLAKFAEKTQKEYQIITNATERARIMAMVDGADKQKAIEEQRFAETLQGLEQQKVEFPALESQINAQIEAEAKAHAKRMEGITTESEEVIRQTRLETAQQWLQNVSTAVDAISNIIESQKQKELNAIIEKQNVQNAAFQAQIATASGNNTTLANIGKQQVQSEQEFAIQKEEIEKKYRRKQQAMAIAQAIINGALAVTNMIANVPLSVLNPATWVGIGIAGVSTAAQIGLIASQKFADGGLAYGPTMGLVGEYPGARSNPEVIAPLNKLQGMLGGMGGNNNGGFEIVEVVLQGSDLHLMLQRYETTLERSGKQPVTV